MSTNITDMVLNKLPAYQDISRKIGSDFSATRKIYDYIRNEKWQKGFQLVAEGNFDASGRSALPQDGYSNMWHALSAMTDDIGAAIYTKIDNFIKNINDIDTCELPALYSIAKNLDYSGDLSFLTFDYPVEIASLLNIYSVNPQRIANQGDILLERFREQYLNDCFIDAATFQNLVTDGAVSGEYLLQGFETSAYNETELAKLTELSANYTALYDKAFLSHVTNEFFKTIVGFSHLRYRSTEIDFPESTEYIWQSISGEIFGQDLYEAPSTTSDDIINLKASLDVSPLFNEIQIVDNITNGKDSIVNYVTKERLVIEAELARREEASLNYEPLSKFSLNREKKVKDYFRLIRIFNNLNPIQTLTYDAAVDVNKVELINPQAGKLELEQLLLETPINYIAYVPNSELQYLVANNKVPYLVASSTIQPSTLRYDVLANVASILTNICIKTYYLRQKLKRLCKGYTLKGSAAYIRYIVRETVLRKIYNVFDTWRYTSGLVEVNQDLAEIFTQINKPKPTEFDVILNTYLDPSEYFNISAIDDYSKFLEIEGNDFSPLDTGITPIYWNTDSDIVNAPSIFSEKQISDILGNTQLDNSINSIKQSIAFMNAVANSAALSDAIFNMNSEVSANTYYTPNAKISNDNLFYSLRKPAYTNIDYNFVPRIFNVGSNSTQNNNIYSLLLSDGKNIDMSSYDILGTIQYDTNRINPTNGTINLTFSTEFEVATPIENSTDINYKLAGTNANLVDNATISLSGLIPGSANLQAFDYPSIAPYINSDTIIQVTRKLEVPSTAVDRLTTEYTTTTETSSFSIAGTIDGITITDNPNNADYKILMGTVTGSITSISIPTPINTDIVFGISGYVDANNMVYYRPNDIILDRLNLQSTNITDFTWSEESVFRRYTNADVINPENGDILNGLLKFQNLKNTHHPSYAPFPYLLNLIESSIFNSLQNFIAIVTDSDSETLANIKERFSGNANINTWKRNNRDFSDYITEYEKLPKLDNTYYENANIGIDGPWNPNALKAFLDDQAGFIASLNAGDNEYYTHLGLSLAQSQEIAEQLAQVSGNQYNDELDTIRDLENAKIYRFATDMFDNQYCLFKKADIETSPGKIWMRLKDHPLSLPLSIQLANRPLYSSTIIPASEIAYDFGVADNLLWALSGDAILGNIVVTRFSESALNFESGINSFNANFDALNLNTSISRQSVTYAVEAASGGTWLDYVLSGEDEGDTYELPLKYSNVQWRYAGTIIYEDTDYAQKSIVIASTRGNAELSGDTPELSTATQAYLGLPSVSGNFNVDIRFNIITQTESYTEYFYDVPVAFNEYPSQYGTSEYEWNIWKLGQAGKMLTLAFESRLTSTTSSGTIDDAIPSGVVNFFGDAADKNLDDFYLGGSTPHEMPENTITVLPFTIEGVVPAITYTNKPLYLYPFSEAGYVGLFPVGTDTSGAILESAKLEEVFANTERVGVQYFCPASGQVETSGVTYFSLSGEHFALYRAETSGTSAWEELGSPKIDGFQEAPLILDKFDSNGTGQIADRKIFTVNNYESGTPNYMLLTDINIGTGPTNAWDTPPHYEPTALDNKNIIVTAKITYKGNNKLEFDLSPGESGRLYEQDSFDITLPADSTLTPIDDELKLDDIAMHIHEEEHRFANSFENIHQLENGTPWQTPTTIPINTVI